MSPVPVSGYSLRLSVSRGRSPVLMPCPVRLYFSVVRGWWCGSRWCTEAVFRLLQVRLHFLHAPLHGVHDRNKFVGYVLILMGRTWFHRFAADHLLPLLFLGQNYLASRCKGVHLVRVANLSSEFAISQSFEHAAHYSQPVWCTSLSRVGQVCVNDKQSDISHGGFTGCCSCQGQIQDLKKEGRRWLRGEFLGTIRPIYGIF